MINCIYVGLGGFAGSIFRYLLGTLPVATKSSFPVVTLAINILGGFVIGILAALSARYGLADSKTILLLKTGLCGGFTTFSTFSLESLNLMQSGNYLYAALYIILSVTLSIAAVYAGRLLLS